MNDDLSLLASAYLDGDVTADERARVEGDPEVLIEVERLRSVRSLLGDVEPPSISVREAQLATALEVWDRLPAPELAGVSAPTPLTSRRRSTRNSSTRWLTGAAAALVLVLAGGVALQLSSGNDTDEVSTADDASTADAETDDSESLAATQRAEDAAGSELAPAAEASDDAAADLDTGIDDEAPPGETGGLDQLDNLTDLADFAAAAVGAPTAPDGPAATSAPDDEELSEAETFLAEAEIPRCLGVDIVVGLAVYGDIPVVVGIDEDRNLAIAHRAATCAEVARVRLPPAGG